jgi:hypothetical protein
VENGRAIAIAYHVNPEEVQSGARLVRKLSPRMRQRVFRLVVSERAPLLRKSDLDETRIINWLKSKNFADHEHLFRPFIGAGKVDLIEPRESNNDYERDRIGKVSPLSARPSRSLCSRSWPFLAWSALGCLAANAKRS